MLFAIILGTFGGAVLAYLSSRWLLIRAADRFATRPQGRSAIFVCGLVFGAISLAPAIFLSVMAGGTLGMRIAGGIAAALGMGGFFASLVLAVEVVLGTVVTVIGNVIIGAALGVLVARSVFGGPPGGVQGSASRGSSPG